MMYTQIPKLNKYLLIGALLCSLSFVGVVSVHAQSSPGANVNLPGSGSNQTNLPGSGSNQTSLPGSGSAPRSTGLPTLDNPLKVKCINDVILLAVDIAMYIGLAIGTIMIIFSGFKFITAEGDPKKVTDARNLFFAVVIGIAVLIGARVIVSAIRATLETSGVVKTGVLGGTAATVDCK